MESSDPSVEIANSLQNIFRIYKIALKFINSAGHRYIFIKIEELTQDIELSLLRLRRHCQATLTNALSHERITPLNKIIAMTQSILMRSQSVEQCKEHAAMIRDCCERLRLMTESQIM